MAQPQTPVPNPSPAIRWRHQTAVSAARMLNSIARPARVQPVPAPVSSKYRPRTGT